MRPLTNTTPKPLLPIGGTPLLLHALSRLPLEVDEFIVVVNYLEEQFPEKLGTTIHNRPATYLKQKERRGTYDAVASAKPLLSEGERFLVLTGDDIHDAESLAEMLRQPGRAMLTFEVDDSRPYGVLTIDEKEIVTSFEEKPENPKSNLVWAGALFLDTDIFKEVPHPHKNGEIYLTAAVHAQLSTHPVRAVRAKEWHTATTPEDLKRLEELLSPKAPQ